MTVISSHDLYSKSAQPHFNIIGSAKDKNFQGVDFVYCEIRNNAGSLCQFN